MMSKFFNYVVTNFGFNSTDDFGNSLLHTKLMALTIPFAMISSVIETSIGLKGLTLLAFIALVLLELVTGLIASKSRGEQIESKKFGRFGLKIFVWLTLLFVLNSFNKQYISETGTFSTLASGLFTWLHGALFIYIDLEYLISVLENLGSLSHEKEKKTLIDAIIGRLNNFLGNEKFSTKKDENSR